MSTTKSEARYRAYLLRLWQENETQPWRAMLEDPRTGERQGFPDLEELFTYLANQTEMPSEPKQTEP